MAQAQFTVTQSDMVTIMRRACLHRFKLRGMLFVLLGLLTAKFGGVYAWPITGVLAALLFVPTSVIFLLIPKMVRQSYATDPSLAQERSFTFGSSGLSYQMGDTTQEKTWRDVSRWHENGRFISLSMTDDAEFVVPVDRVSTTFINSLKERLTRSGLTKPRRARRV